MLFSRINCTFLYNLIYIAELCLGQLLNEYLAMSKVQLFQIVSATVIAVFLVGCSSSDGTNSNPTQPVPEAIQLTSLVGVWSAPAYGQLFQFKQTDTGYTSTQFTVTQDSCLQNETLNNLTTADLEAVTRLTEDPNQIEIHSEGEVLTPGVEFQRLTSLPQLCTESLLATKGEPRYEFDPQRDFQIFWNTFNELYFDFTLSGTDWQAI